MKHSLWVLLATAALAGCSGGDDGGPAGPACGPDQYVDAEGACADHVEPHIMATGMPDTLQQFQSVTFNWSIMPGTRGSASAPVHSMDSRILASTEAAVTDNTTLPDSWGTVIAQQQHKNLPQNFTATFSWDDVATVYVKGYMFIYNSEHVWQDLGTITVGPVTATGDVTSTITISFPPELDNSEVTVTVGDAVAFTNDAPYDYTITFTGEGCPSGATIASESTKQFDFLAPGSCAFVLLSPVGEVEPEYDPGELSGKVTVSKP